MNKIIEKIDFFIDKSAKKLESKSVRVPINTIGALLFISVSSILLFLLPSQIKVNTASQITARTFPQLMLRIILFFSIFLFIKEIFAIVLKKDREYKEINLLVEVRFIILLMLLILFLVMLHFTSFIVSSIIYGILMLFYFRSKKILSYIIIILAAFIIGFLFQNILHVRLP